MSTKVADLTPAFKRLAAANGLLPAMRRLEAANVPYEFYNSGGGVMVVEVKLTDHHYLLVTNDGVYGLDDEWVVYRYDVEVDGDEGTWVYVGPALEAAVDAIKLTLLREER